MKPTTITRITWLLLTLGFASALVIYLTAEPVTLAPLTVDPRYNKKYVRQVRDLGGKGSLAIIEAMDDFESLWHGPALGGTVAVLTVAVTLAFRFVALRPELYAPDPNFYSPSRPPKK